MENNVILYEQKYLESFKKLSELKKVKKEIEAIEKDVKAELSAALDEYDIKSIKNEYVSISRVKETSKTEIDLEKLKDAEPDLYNELLADYPKVSSKKAYIRIEAK